VYQESVQRVIDTGYEYMKQIKDTS